MLQGENSKPHAGEKVTKGTQTGNSASTRTFRVLLILAAVTVAFSYLTGLDLALYADDFYSWHTVANAGDLSDLLTTTYNPEFYRPLEYLLIRANQVTMGNNPFLYHLLTVFGHMAVCFVLAWLARGLGFSRETAGLSALLFALNQNNAMAVLGADTASQVYSVLFGLMSLAVIVWPKELRLKHTAVAALLMLVSVLWKDSGASFLLAVGLFVLIRIMPRIGFAATVRLMTPFGVMLALYFMIRQGVGVIPPGIGKEGRYQIWFGKNVLVNTALFAVGMISPVASTILVLHTTNIIVLLVTGIWIILCGVALPAGLRMMMREGGDARGRIFLTAAMTLCLFLPDVLVKRVSELYIYKPLTLFTILFAAALWRLWQYAGTSKAKKTLAVTLLAAFVFLNLFSIRHKQHIMRNNGTLAHWMIGKIKKQVPSVPDGTEVVCVNMTEGPGMQYSIYVMHGVYVLHDEKVFSMLYNIKPRLFHYALPENLVPLLAKSKGPVLLIRYNDGNIRADKFTIERTPAPELESHRQLRDERDLARELNKPGNHTFLATGKRLYL